MKIYSHTISADDQTTITHQRIYTTPKGNFVFHQHTRPNWEGYWREDENRAMPQGVTESTVLKICSNLDELDGAIPTPVLASIQGGSGRNRRTPRYLAHGKDEADAPVECQPRSCVGWLFIDAGIRVDVSEFLGGNREFHVTVGAICTREFCNDFRNIMATTRCLFRPAWIYVPFFL